MDTPFNTAPSLFADALPGLDEITCWATTLAHDELELDLRGKWHGTRTQEAILPD